MKRNKKEERPFTIPVLILKDIKGGDNEIILLKNKCNLIKGIKYKTSYYNLMSVDIIKYEEILVSVDDTMYEIKYKDYE